MTTENEAFKPSTEIASTILARLNAMTQDQITELDNLVTPEIAKALILLLPELGELINAVSDEQKVKATQKIEPKVVSDEVNSRTMAWWQKNPWFNHPKFPRETAAVKAIDVLLDIEGYDKNSDLYYVILDQRLRAILPKLKVMH